jgi:hypothetical protein
MESLLPLDNTLITTIRDLKNQQHASSVSTQSYIGDWYPLLSTLYTYYADNYLAVDPSEMSRFSVGKRLRLTQGIQKFFYIIKVDTINNRLKITGGDDYTYENAPIQSIDLGTNDNPIGFPPAFRYTLVSPTAGEFIGLQDCNFYMSNALVSLNFNTSAWSKSSGDTPTVTAGLPIIGNGDRMHWHSGIRITNNGSTVGGDLLINDTRFVLYKWGSGNFIATGIGAIGVTFSITYLCNE